MCSASSIMLLHVLVSLLSFYAIFFYVLLTHLPVDGHLGYFWFLALLKNVAMNVAIHVIMDMSSFFMGKLLGLGLLGCLVSCFKNPKCFQKWSYFLTFLVCSVQGAKFAPSPKSAIVYLFN